MKRTVSTILALALSGALLAACDNAGQPPSGAGGTADRSSTDTDRTKRATPGTPTSPTAPGGAAGSGSSSGSTNK